MVSLFGKAGYIGLDSWRRQALATSIAIETLIKLPPPTLPGLVYYLYLKIQSTFLAVPDHSTTISMYAMWNRNYAITLQCIGDIADIAHCHKCQQQGGRAVSNISGELRGLLARNPDLLLRSAPFWWITLDYRLGGYGSVTKCSSTWLSVAWE